MGAADSQAAVAHGDHDVQVRAGHFNPGGIGQGATVQAVEGVGIEKGVKQTGAPDVRYDGDLLSSESHALKGLIQRRNDPFMGASRTEDRRAILIQQTIHDGPPPRSGGV